MTNVVRQIIKVAISFCVPKKISEKLYIYSVDWKGQNFNYIFAYVMEFPAETRQEAFYCNHYKLLGIKKYVL